MLGISPYPGCLSPLPPRCPCSLDNVFFMPWPSARRRPVDVMTHSSTCTSWTTAAGSCLTCRYAECWCCRLTCVVLDSGIEFAFATGAVKIDRLVRYVSVAWNNSPRNLRMKASRQQWCYGCSFLPRKKCCYHTHRVSRGDRSLALPQHVFFAFTVSLS